MIIKNESKRDAFSSTKSYNPIPWDVNPLHRLKFHSIPVSIGKTHRSISLPTHRMTLRRWHKQHLCKATEMANIHTKLWWDLQRLQHDNDAKVTQGFYNVGKVVGLRAHTRIFKVMLHLWRPCTMCWYPWHGTNTNSSQSGSEREKLPHKEI